VLGSVDGCRSSSGCAGKEWQFIGGGVGGGGGGGARFAASAVVISR